MAQMSRCLKMRKNALFFFCHGKVRPFIESMTVVPTLYTAPPTVLESVIADVVQLKIASGRSWTQDQHVLWLGPRSLQ